MTEPWRRQALDLLQPTPAQDERIRSAARRLRDRIARELEERGWEGTPRVEGSLAKGTYLRGHADADVFVAFPPTVDRDELVARVEVLGEVLEHPVMAYAEHPYVQGKWETLEAEIVPCYAVEDPGKLRSAVDRTPFHTEYVRARLDDDARGEVRLFKAFLQHVEAYGAEESVLGFSGYLAELAVLRFGRLEAVLDWALEGFPHPVVLEGRPEDVDRGAFDDPLVVIDPVDPSRNAAAAVTRPVLQRVREAAAAFRAAPSASWFEPAAPAEMTLERAEAICRARGTRVLAIGLPVAPELLEDPLHAQLRRAARLAVDVLQREQVPVSGAAVHIEDGEDRWAWVMVEARAPALARPKLHQGPPARAGEHADRFRKRWAGTPDAAGEVFEREGHLFVHRRRSQETLLGVVEPHLAQANAGKAVDAALADGRAQRVEGDPALERLSPRARARLLDRRRPWERG